MQGSLPQYTFTQLGRYQVLMSVSDTNGCLDTLRSWVQVQPSPLSAFSYEQNVDNTQGQLQFTDGSLGAMEYHWDFGNGEQSTAPSPMVTYQQDGTYRITLVTLNEQGCSDTTSMDYHRCSRDCGCPMPLHPQGRCSRHACGSPWE
jgi:PKD repeat protein